MHGSGQTHKGQLQKRLHFVLQGCRRHACSFDLGFIALAVTVAPDTLTCLSFLAPFIQSLGYSNATPDFGPTKPVLAAPHDPWAARLSSTKQVGRPFLGSINALPAALLINPLQTARTPRHIARERLRPPDHSEVAAAMARFLDDRGVQYAGCEALRYLHEVSKHRFN
jgi:hypothetical protein